MKIFYLILFFFSVTAVNAQPKTDLQKKKLNGKIKSVKTKWSYRYKSDGKNFTPWADEDGSIETYSATGQLQTVQYFKKGTEWTSTTKYTYRPKQNEYELKGYWPDGRVINGTLYKTDSKGNILEESRLDSAGKLRDTYKYNYDEKGNLLSFTGYSAEGKLTSKTIYTNNNKGEKISLKVETPGYASTVKNYQYDDKGNVSVEEWPAVAGLHGFRFERTYDEYNNMIREQKYIDGKPAAYISTWKYEYDCKGNLIKKTEYSGDNEPFSVYEYTIQYY